MGKKCWHNSNHQFPKSKFFFWATSGSENWMVWLSCVELLDQYRIQNNLCLIRGALNGGVNVVCILFRRETVTILQAGLHRKFYLFHDLTYPLVGSI